MFRRKTIFYNNFVADRLSHTLHDLELSSSFPFTDCSNNDITVNALLIYCKRFMDSLLNKSKKKKGVARKIGIIHL